MSASADGDLVRRFLAGEPSALRELYDLHARAVFGFALRCLRSHHDAEDVTQQVFVRAWRGRATFDHVRGRLGPWLLAIARRQVADRLTARTRDSEVLSRAGRMATNGRPRGVPDHVVEAVVVADELNRLPAQQRTVGSAGVLRRPDPSADRRADRAAARHGQESPTAWAGAAARTVGG